MTEHDEQDESQPESAEGEVGKKISEKTPETASGEGDTPLGASDQHSDAPGPTGTG
jgi:hypothetical protein